MVLEGAQGIGKSQLCKALGGKWTGDFTIDPHNKDTVDSMQGKWFVELAEMSVLRRAEMAALKAFISRDSDRVRQAYGRLTREFPRQCIFIGSINPEADQTYLQDSTGNRRFWPIECGAAGVKTLNGGEGRIDFRGVAAVRDQLFAEALELVNSKKESLYMDNIDLEREAAVEAGKRHAEDPWTERILSWLSDPVPGLGSGKGREFVTAREVFIDAMGGIDKQLSRRDMISIANVMRSLGWKSGLKWIEGHPVRGYSRPKARKAVEDHLSRGGAGAGPKSEAAAPAPSAAAPSDPLDGLV
jgi:predicted P-loop ATPase